MDCVVCNKMGATYRLVGPETVAVCEQCVAEHLSGDLDTETCLYCDTAAPYDLAEDTGAVAGTETPEEYDVVSEGVVCGDHVSTFRREDA